MTLYELCNNITLQGNIEIKVFAPNGDEDESFFYRDEYDFNIAYTDHPELEDTTVSYMYPSKSYDGTVWFIIEVTKEDEA